MPVVSSTMNPADIRRSACRHAGAARIGFVWSALILGSGIGSSCGPMYPITRPRHLLSYHRTPVDLRTTVLRVIRTAYGVVRSRRERWRGLPREFQVAHHRPQIADEFARDGHHGNLWAAPQGESMIHRVQALLRFPCGQRDGG